MIQDEDHHSPRHFRPRWRTFRVSVSLSERKHHAVFVKADHQRHQSPPQCYHIMIIISSSASAAISTMYTHNNTLPVLFLFFYFLPGFVWVIPLPFFSLKNSSKYTRLRFARVCRFFISLYECTSEKLVWYGGGNAKNSWKKCSLLPLLFFTLGSIEAWPISKGTKSKMTRVRAPYFADVTLLCFDVSMKLPPLDLHL